jgi:hypothetical protein
MGLPWSVVMSSSRMDSNQNGQYALLRLLCTFLVFTLYHQILRKQILNIAPFDVFIAYNLPHSMPSAQSMETVAAFVASC